MKFRRALTRDTKTKDRPSGIAGFILSAWLTSGLAAADWPRFLGPSGNNTAPATNLLERFPETGPPVVWQREIGAGYSAPSVLGDTLVLHHRLADEEIVEALDAQTGKSRWRRGDLSTYEDPYGYNNGPRCTPLLTSNRCYTLGASGRLLCLDLATGVKIWERQVLSEWKVPRSFFGVSSSPALEDGRLFVMVGGLPASGMAALDAATGQTLWQNVGEPTWQGTRKTGWPGEPEVQWAEEDHQASYSSPVLATFHGRRHLLCFMRQGLVSLDPASGTLNFRYWFRSRVAESVNAMTPVAAENAILLSSAYYRQGSVLLKVAPDGKSVEPAWRNANLEVHWSTPVLRDGRLFAFSGRNESDARFRCVDFLTGNLLWDRDERWRKGANRQPSVYGRGSLLLADNKLIVLGEGGLLGLFRPNPVKDEELSRWQAPKLHYPCWTAPILARRKLYLRSENQLLCLDLARRLP